MSISKTIIDSMPESSREVYFQVYYIIKKQYSSKIRTNGAVIGQIAERLSLNELDILVAIKELENLGMIESGGKEWVFIVGNKRFSEKYNLPYSNQNYDFSFADVINKDKIISLLKEISDN